MSTWDLSPRLRFLQAIKKTKRTKENKIVEEENEGK